MIIHEEYVDKTYLIRLLQYYNKLTSYEILNYELIGEDYDKTLNTYDLVSVQSLIEEIITQAPPVLSCIIELVEVPHSKKRKNVTKRIRQLVYDRDDGVCQCCGKPLRLGTVDCTVDHIVPRKYGGNSSDISNLQLLCRDCNLRKADRIISNTDLFKEMIMC